jgi:heat shock protein HslJ
MKRILFILPLSALLTYCSSSRQATAPAAPGVSNVQVNGAGTTASATTSVENRDWGYKASRDTAMSGTWQLEGMVAADGSWKSAQSWVPVDTTLVTTDSTAVADGTSTTTSGSTTTTTGTSNKAQSSASNSGSTGSVGAQGSSKSKSFGARLYDTSTHFFDTAAFQQTLSRRIVSFNYWQRLPEIRIMPSLGIFTGNTGCNSMSGSFNFSGTDLKVDNRIRTSKMACNDYDESAFIGDLLKADSYTINNGMLEFKKGGHTLLSFKKKV